MVWALDKRNASRFVAILLHEWVTFTGVKGQSGGEGLRGLSGKRGQDGLPGYPGLKGKQGCNLSGEADRDDVATSNESSLYQKRILCVDV